MTKLENNWQALSHEKLTQHITYEAQKLQYLKNCADSRDLTDDEIKEWEISHRILTNATNALRIKFAY